MIQGAKLTVYVTIDNNRVKELESEGYTDKEIEHAIKNAITLKDKPTRQPVCDIESIFLEKYY